MSHADSPQYARFRQEVREWIETTVPPSVKRQPLGIFTGPGMSREQVAPLEAALAKKGWLAPSWPKRYGGAEFDTMQMVILDEEMALAGIPPYRNLQGITMVGPILMRFGTEEQKQRFLPPTLNRKIIWAQGYSEPGAGSDLASLALRAEPIEGGFRLNGQKIWTSRAHFADWIFLLARTDPAARPKQNGISFLLVDRHSPGITIRPIVTIDGHHHFNETFYENVFVPRENLVGEMNKGWTVAKALLGYERFTTSLANPHYIATAIGNLRRAAREAPLGGPGALWDDPALRRQVAQLEMDAESLALTRMRYLAQVARGLNPGPETMLLKLYGSELVQRLVALHQQALGPLGVLWEGAPFPRETVELGAFSANVPSVTIAGGTSEVHRNVIAKRVLGLPDEGKPARP
ncbi:MAG: acyl-CoA dehydrogenase family protein [Candidatus Lambdaproteobacteria bacterium]|nr:acyl-CoA dehydrogenase family protein [Candidatus Lambdaproteobacteria bacterium]